MDNKVFHFQQGVYKYLNDMKDLLNTLLIIIAVIDPLGSIPVYLEATKQFDKKHKRKIAINASITASFCSNYDFWRR